MGITGLVIILLVSYAVVNIIKKLNTIIAIISTVIVIYSIYTVLEKAGIGGNMVIKEIITNTQELLQKIVEFVEIITQQL